MLQRRGSLCALAALASLAVPTLSGCASAESGPSSAQASGGGIAALEGGPRGEADEAELKQVIDRETTPEERQELREGLEAEQSEAGQQEAAQEEAAQERSEPGAEQLEGTQEQEAESGSEREREAEGEPERERG